VKRLLALLLGGLGLRALLRRRQEPAHVASPAEGLRAKLAETRAVEEHPDQPADVDQHRADVHEQARRAIDELRE
jgi:hypothetical protein